ncbi:hypothetical protein ACIPSE_32160 [Streptomyces sp. NPDC090106]|uniref:hypothetical protein n=1 Tax=Streptomyces sp. NPDC090106 TaxID=3365946 RepID=UPI003822ABC0
MTTTTLEIELLGAFRGLAAVPLPSGTSRPDGRPLRRFAVELHVPDERHRELEGQLHAAATPEGPHLRGNEGRWRVLDGWSKLSTGRRHEILVYRVEIQETDIQETQIGETDIQETQIEETDIQETEIHETEIHETEIQGAEGRES